MARSKRGGSRLSEPEWRDQSHHFITRARARSRRTQINEFCHRIFQVRFTKTYRRRCVDRLNLILTVHCCRLLWRPVNGYPHPYRAQEPEFKLLILNRHSVILEVSEATSRRLQCLNLAVESLCRSVADSVRKPGDDLLEMSLDHLRYIVHRIQSTTRCLGVYEHRSKSVSLVGAKT